ncbi:MAG: hypothetical protein SGI92_09360 [Bryobacteraceae bacterium]|nr:hypothetical protein [Bryobacteraceae bacterium]
MPRHHVFELIITINETVMTVPDPNDIVIAVGDTVKYHSRFGKVTINWDVNVFDRPRSTELDILTVTSAGPFSGTCIFERPDGKIIGWKGEGTGGKSVDGEQGDPGTPS